MAIQTSVTVEGNGHGLEQLILLTSAIQSLVASRAALVTPTLYLPDEEDELEDPILREIQKSSEADDDDDDDDESEADATQVEMEDEGLSDVKEALNELIITLCQRASALCLGNDPR